MEAGASATGALAIRIRCGGWMSHRRHRAVSTAVVLQRGLARGFRDVSDRHRGDPSRGPQAASTRDSRLLPGTAAAPTRVGGNGTAGRGGLHGGTATTTPASRSSTRNGRPSDRATRKRRTSTDSGIPVPHCPANTPTSTGSSLGRRSAVTAGSPARRPTAADIPSAAAFPARARYGTARDKIQPEADLGGRAPTRAEVFGW
jgi:hypothetical protein